MCTTNCRYHIYNLVRSLNGSSINIVIPMYWSPVKNLCHTPESQDELPSVSSLTLLSFLCIDDVWNLGWTGLGRWYESSPCYHPHYSAFSTLSYLPVCLSQIVTLHAAETRRQPHAGSLGYGFGCRKGQPCGVGCSARRASIIEWLFPRQIQFGEI